MCRPAASALVRRVSSNMYEGLHRKRIVLNLCDLQQGQIQIPKVEHDKLAFAGYIRNLTKIIDASPTARAMLRDAINNGVSVGLDPLLEPSSSFFYEQQNHFDLGFQPDLLQRTEKGISRYLVSFIAGLRRAWHYHRDFTPSVFLKPVDFLEHIRVLEADVEAVTHLIAWELRGSGAAFFWRYLLSSANGDISVVFERAAMEDPHNAFNGTAILAAFNQWYAERERMNAADHFALEMIDLALISALDKRNFGGRSLSRSDLYRVGQLPSGKNYLDGCPFNSLWYQGLDDDINRMHLRHIELDIEQLLEKQN